MAATGSHDNHIHGAEEALPQHGAGELQARLEEEVSRAERSGTALSCLLVSVDTEPFRDERGGELPEQAVVYMADALRQQLRRFDRVGRLSPAELLVLLPGADGPRAEVVARRSLARLQAVKIETDRGRRPIGVTIGLGSWSDGLDAAQLLARTRLAARRRGRSQPSYA